MTSDRNDSVKNLNHWDSFLPDISDSILKSNYAKLLARRIYVSFSELVTSVGEKRADLF